MIQPPQLTYRLFEKNRVIKSSASAMALLSVIGTAHAQSITTEKYSEENIIEVVEVTGIRQATENNIAIKRESNSFIDAITAENIGQFPDKNVADALQRVSGITIFRNGGEGSSVSVRGMSPGATFTQLNGNYLASNAGEPGRSFNFNLLPSTMVERVEVMKSIEARHDEGGIGGTVNVHTRKPLDLDAHTFLSNMEGTYADVTEEIDPHYSFLYSWKDDSERLGALIGYTSQTRRNRTLGAEAQQWEWWTPYDENDQPAISAVDQNGNLPPEWASAANFRCDSANTSDACSQYSQGFWSPRFVRGSVHDEKRERKGLQATVQFRPTDAWTLGANYFRFNLGLDSVTNMMDMPEWPLSFIYSAVEDVDFAGNPAASGAIVNGVSVYDNNGGDVDRIILPWLRATYNREESTSDTYDFFAEYESDQFNIRLVAGNTKAEGGPTEAYGLAYYSGNHGDPVEAPIENAAAFAQWAVSGSDFRYTIDPEIHNNLAQGIGGNPDPDATGSSYTRGVQEETYGQVDFTFYVDAGPISAIRSGIKARQATVDRGTFNTYFFQKGHGNTDILNTSGYRKLLHTNGQMPDLAEILADQPMNNIAGGFDTNIFPYIDVHKYRNLLEQRFEKQIFAEPNFVFNIEENTLAYYLQADFEQGDIRGNFGIRVVETELTGTSADKTTRFLDWFDDETGENLINSGVGIEEELVLNTETSKRTDVLPSFNIAWEPIDDLIVRGAYYETLTRPGYSSVSGEGEIRLISQEVVDDRPILAPLQGWFGRGSNKRLAPTRSKAMDVGLEWYANEGTTVGATYFHKDIPNFIASISIPQDRIVDGQVEPFYEYSTSQNASDAGVDGFEVFATYIHDSGFGFNTNYTKLNPEKGDVLQPATEAEIAEGAEPFVKIGEANLSGLSEDSFNFSTFYENEWYSVRIAYNYRGKQVGGSAFLPIVSDAYDQFDFNANYNISDNLSATFAVVNLMKSEQNSYKGEDTTARFVSNSYSGRRAYAGLNYRF